MYDGINFQYPIADFQQWKERIAKTVKFTVPVYEETGEQKGRSYATHTSYTHRAQFENYYLSVLETHKANGVSYLLKIDGSLHKNHFGGKNYQRFSYPLLIEEINRLCAALHLNPAQCEIKNLEFGVNIPFLSSPIAYIDESVLLHKTEEFIRYEKKDGICLGRYAKHAQYSVKVYDKGLQNNLPEPLLRIELRFVKMQPLNKIGIATIADIAKIEHAPTLLKLLCRAWIEVLVNEPEINIDTLNLTATERKLITMGRYRDHWKNLATNEPEKFKYQRRQYRALMSKYGSNTQSLVLELIKTEWQQMTNSPNLPLAYNRAETEQFPEFTVKVKGKKGERLTNANINARRCRACGRDISHQRSNSLSCSPKYVGDAAAHKCRNAISNPRNNFKNKIKRLEAKGLLFDIMPYFSRQSA